MPATDGKKPKKKKVADLSERSAKRRGSGRPFPKGVSPNPGGRPASMPEVRAFLLSQSLPAAQVLAEIMTTRSAQHKDRLAAAKTILDFSLPKPKDAGETSTADALALLAAALRPPAPAAAAPPAATDTAE